MPLKIIEDKKIIENDKSFYLLLYLSIFMIIEIKMKNIKNLFISSLKT